jgi:hypothetical protein
MLDSIRSPPPLYVVLVLPAMPWLPEPQEEYKPKNEEQYPVHHVPGTKEVAGQHPWPKDQRGKQDATRRFCRHTGYP